MSSIDDLPPLTDGSREVSITPAAAAVLRATPTDAEIEAAAAEYLALSEAEDVEAASIAFIEKTTGINERIAASRNAALTVAEAWDASRTKSQDEVALEVSAEFERYADMAGSQLTRMLAAGFDRDHAQHAGLQVHGAMISIAMGGGA